MAAKIRFLPILVASLIGLIGALLLSQLHINIWLESPDTQAGPLVIEPEPLPADSLVSPTPTAPPKSPQAIADGLRVSNQTDVPIRLVLLPRSAQTSNSPNSAGPGVPSRNLPVQPGAIHWDFAPMEGSTEGLILSMPNQNLKLESGDVLTAFALDGSKRYWGPYVVGATATPVRQGKPAEWGLVFKP